MNVKCVETGEVFGSKQEVLDQFHIDGKTLWQCFQKSSRTAGGYHWKEIKVASKKKKAHSRVVRGKKKKQVTYEGNYPDTNNGWIDMGNIYGDRYKVFGKASTKNEKLGYFKICLIPPLRDVKANFNLSAYFQSGGAWKVSKCKAADLFKRYHEDVYMEFEEFIQGRML